jgi:hypothetical protein
VGACAVDPSVGEGWSAPAHEARAVDISPVGRRHVSAVLGVPTVVRTQTWLAFDVRVSDALTAALDRGSGELALGRLPG